VYTLTDISTRYWFVIPLSEVSCYSTMNPNTSISECCSNYSISVSFCSSSYNREPTSSGLRILSRTSLPQTLRTLLPTKAKAKELILDLALFL